MGNKKFGTKRRKVDEGLAQEVFDEEEEESEEDNIDELGNE